jgi:outer membrane immunogenic protein
LSAAVAGGSAGAADLVVKTRPAQAVAWDGFYGGLAIGGRWTDARWTTLDFGGLVPPFTDEQASFGTAGARLGGYVGFNRRIGAWLWGLEADLGYSFNSDLRIAGIPGTGIGFARPTNSDETGIATEWDGSVRLRAGVLVQPDVLVYGTGGAAFQSVTLRLSCGTFLTFGTCIPGTLAFADSRVRVGWTGGVGLEVLHSGDWHSRLEYRYADFGTIDHTFVLAPQGGDVVMNALIRTHIATIGIGRKLSAFDGAEGGKLHDVMPAGAPPVWHGIYVGAAFGGQLNRPQWTATADVSAPFADTFAQYDITVPHLAGFIGLNAIQSGRLVLGAEAEVGTSFDAEREIVGIPGAARGTLAPNPDRSSIASSWDGSLVARFGYLLTPRAMAYTTAGVAAQRVTLRASCDPAGSAWCILPHAEELQRTLTGWTVGAGLEAAFRAVRLRADYRYARYGAFTHVWFAGTVDQIAARVELETHRVSVGAAYQFGGR